MSFQVVAGDFDLYRKSGQRSAQWDSMVKAGFESFDGGDLETGIVFMQKAYNLGCRDGLLLFKTGLYYEAKKNYREAAKYFEESSPKLAGQYPDYSETKRIHEHLGRVYYQLDQYDKALPELEAALQLSPDNFMLLFMSAQMYRLQKRYPEAIANFEKALSVNPPTPPLQKEGQGGFADPRKIIFTELMALYYEIKDFDKCLKIANYILSVVPNDPAALSYKRDIQTTQYKLREQEAIKKIIQ